GHVGGVSGNPAETLALPFPFLGGDHHAGGGIGQFNAGGLIQAKAFAFCADQIDAGGKADLVEVNVAAAFEGCGEVNQAEAAAAVFGEEAVADAEMRAAYQLFLGGNEAVAESGDGGDDLESGTGRVKSLSGPVEPGSPIIDVLVNRLWDEWRE